MHRGSSPGDRLDGLHEGPAALERTAGFCSRDWVIVIVRAQPHAGVPTHTLLG